jgi:hypothetical protein
VAVNGGDEDDPGTANAGARFDNFERSAIEAW